MIGETFGNYRVTELIGEGGMGVVYLAEHPGIGRRAAIKILRPGLTDNAEMTKRFFNEARAANAIRHPGIVEVYDCGTLASGTSYIVMELLEGENLAARLRTIGRLPAPDARRIAAQTASALAAAHAAGIVHRDLKPDNLFLVPDERDAALEMVKVLDFGIAKLGQQASNTSSVRTRTGSVMGTPAYMSPEQCRGTREIDHRTDIYALGVILFEMLCGRPPFVSEGFGEMVHLHISAAAAGAAIHRAFDSRGAGAPDPLVSRQGARRARADHGRCARGAHRTADAARAPDGADETAAPGAAADAREPDDVHARARERR